MKAQELFDLTLLQSIVDESVELAKLEDSPGWIVETIVDSLEGQYITSSALVAFGATVQNADYAGSVEKGLIPDDSEWKGLYFRWNEYEHNPFGMLPTPAHYAWHNVEWKYEELDRVSDSIADELNELITMPTDWQLYFGHWEADSSYCLILCNQNYEEAIE